LNNDDLNTIIENLKKQIADLPADTRCDLAMKGLLDHLIAAYQPEDMGRNPEHNAANDELQEYTAKDVAGFWKVTEPYVYELMRKGELPFVGFGKYRRILHKDLLDFVGRHRKNTIDGHEYATYTSAHERKRTPQNPKTVGIDAAADGRSCGSCQKLNSASGTRRNGNPGTVGKIDSIDRRIQNQTERQAVKNVQSLETQGS
jgi:excisionase family DNA binding protein